MRRLRNTTVLAAAVAAALATFAPAAGAAPVDLDDPFLLIGAGPTIWDSQTQQPGCEASSAYTPVYEGASYAGRRLRASIFSGGGALLNFDGADFDDLDGVGDYRAKSRTLRVGPTNLFDVRVSRQETARGPWLRSLVRLTNTRDTPYSGFVIFESRLDLTTSPLATSSGDQTFTAADRWVIPAIPPDSADSWYDYQQVGIAFAGRGARQGITDVTQNPALTSCYSARLELRLPPGATRYMLFFHEQHTTRKAVRDAIRKYDRRTLTKPLLRGIPKQVRARVLNWDL